MLRHDDNGDDVDQKGDAMMGTALTSLELEAERRREVSASERRWVVRPGGRVEGRSLELNGLMDAAIRPVAELVRLVGRAPRRA